MFKHQVEPRAMGEWFYCKGFEQFEYMTTFLLVNESTDYGKLLLICFFFTITLTILMSISIEKFLGKQCMREREKQIASSPSHRFHGLFFTLIEHKCPPISAREIVQLL